MYDTGIISGIISIQVLSVTDDGTKVTAVSTLNKDQLSLTNPRDAVHHGERAVNK